MLYTEVMHVSANKMSMFYVSLAGQTHAGRESGQIPIIISFLTRQEFLGVLIGLVNNEARGCLFWHV